MAEQPASVTPADITALLRDMAAITPDTPLADQLAWHERKARLLNQLAASLDSPAAYQVAAEAWHQCGQLAQALRQGGRAVKLSTFSGEQVVQVTNPDRFAPRPASRRRAAGDQVVVGQVPVHPERRECQLTHIGCGEDAV